MEGKGFNREAEKMNCKARIKKIGKNVQFQKCIGIDSKGFELVVKITSAEFSCLIANFPSLQ